MELKEIFFDIPLKLLDFAKALRDWMFKSIDVFGYEVSIWQLLGGSAVGVLGVIILISIVKD